MARRNALACGRGRAGFGRDGGARGQRFVHERTSIIGHVGFFDAVYLHLRHAWERTNARDKHTVRALRFSQPSGHVSFLLQGART
eukprot:2557493-Prymnesium_polylepis.1